MIKLSNSAQAVQKVLKDLGFDNQVVEHTETTRTSQDAANAIGCTVGQIAKSLIFKGKQTEQPILVIASGANRVNEKRIREYIGEPLAKADADFVRGHTGYVIGGIPPIGHVTKMRTFIDQDLMEYDEIWAAAGTPNAVFQLTPDQLVNMTKGEVAITK